MKNIISERAAELLICLITFLLSFCCFSLVVDDYSFFASSLAAKQFCDFSYYDVHFQGYIGIREIYKMFYYFMPKLNWHFIFSIISQFMSLYLVLRALKTIVLRNVNSLLVIRTIQAIFSLFFIENIISVSHTRVSLIFCGVAAFNLAFARTYKIRDIIVYNSIFILGLLLRPESSMGTLLLIMAGFLIYSFDLKDMIKRLWIPALSVTVFLSVFTIDLMYTDIYVRKIEPEIEYKIMANQMVGIDQMKTAKDSVKYRAAKIGMWFDTKEMSPEFLRSILLPYADLSYSHSREIYFHVLSFYTYYIFIDFVLVALIITCLLICPDRKTLIPKILIFSLFTFLVIYALDYNGFLVCNRHFLNLQFTSLFVLGFFLFNTGSNQKINKKKTLLTIILLSLLPGLGLTLYKYKIDNIIVDQKTEAVVQTMKKFETMYSNRIVVCTIDSRFLFDQHFFVTNENYTKNTYIMYDWFTFAITPRYVDYLSRTCHCDSNDPVAFFHWLADQKALYLAIPYRYHLTEDYMRIVHACPVTFEDSLRINSLIDAKNFDTKDVEVRTVRILPQIIKP